MDVNYWSERAEKIEEEIYNDTLKHEKNVFKIFRDSAKEVEKEISAFILEYAKDNKLSFAEASKNLTMIEKSDYNRQMKKLLSEYKKTGSKILLERIERLEARKVVTRLDAIKNKIEAHMSMMTEDINIATNGFLMSEYEKAYYYNLHTLAKGLNKEVDETISKEALSLLLIPFSGLTCEARMWKVADKIVSSIIEALQTGLVQGKTVTQINDDIKKKFKRKGVKGYNNFDISRVIRTETIFVQEQAVSDANKKYNVAKYRIVVTKDERTCSHCMARDGEVHLESERVPMVTSPPFHAQCRCTTASVTEEE